MVKLTIVGRVSDGLPLAQGPRYMNEEKNYVWYKQQGELLLKEITTGALTPSKMTVFVDHHCFNYLVANGICYMTLCDSSYPRKLAFYYLQDLQSELEKFDVSLIEKISIPYSFVRFESVTANIRKLYIDTRTQANLSKLNADRRQDPDIIAKHLSEILERRRRLEILERVVATTQNVSPIWGSPRLEFFYAGNCIEMDAHYNHLRCSFCSLMEQPSTSRCFDTYKSLGM